MSKKKKVSADPNEEVVETKKAKKEKKAKNEKTPMDLDSKKTLAKSITALICVIAVCVTAVVNTGKLCDAAKKASREAALQLPIRWAVTLITAARFRQTPPAKFRQMLTARFRQTLTAQM